MTPAEIIQNALQKFERVAPGDLYRVNREELVAWVKRNPEAAAKVIGVQEERRTLTNRRRFSHRVIASIAEGTLFARESLHECWIKAPDGSDVRLSRAKADVVESLQARSQENVDRATAAHEQTREFAGKVLPLMREHNLDVESAVEQLSLFDDQHNYHEPVAAEA